MPFEQPVVEQQIESEAPMSSENAGIEMQQPVWHLRHLHARHLLAYSILTCIYRSQLLPWVPRPTFVVVNPLDANAVDADAVNNAVKHGESDQGGVWSNWSDEYEMMMVGDGIGIDSGIQKTQILTMALWLIQHNTDFPHFAWCWNRSPSDTAKSTSPRFHILALLGFDCLGCAWVKKGFLSGVAVVIRSLDFWLVRINLGIKLRVMRYIGYGGKHYKAIPLKDVKSSFWLAST